MLLQLHTLRFHAFHGCLPQEQKVGNDYTLDLELTLPDNPTATEKDRLDGTINYTEVARVATEIMTEPVSLIEHVAHKLCIRLLLDFPMLENVRVKLCKLAPPMPYDIASACIVMEKHRQDHHKYK